MRLRFVRLEPDELVMEATYSGDAGMPPRHIHPSARELGQAFFAEFENEFRLA